MFIVLLVVRIQLSIQTQIEFKHLGRPCHVNHCDNDDVCVRRTDILFRCVPKSYFKQHDPLVDDSPDDPKGRSIENCHPMVSYMFYRFDTTNDSELNDDELNSIEHLKDESCTDIFFQRCDHDGDHRLFPYELFNCFQYALLPCELHNQDLDKAFWNKSMEGIFRPRCNSNVYYAARQCNLNTPRECWCVNKHGIEVEGTRQYDDHMPQCDEIEDSRTTEIV
ncbi:unnamed protein product [Rotaria magnacalcarata]|uniref:Thyroglobulin type-1 domain-containing protein n=2 Tax=Rotaria magnacalcarata TaxID=392030 RepID=A0A815H7I3_9BILA|nr:unnamed protein product [Rotaria magnacalcarata]